MNRLYPRGIALAVSLASSVPAVHAAGLEFPWQSTSAMGTAQANAAEAADASTIYFNPAGMTRLKGTQVSQGAQLLSVRGRFDDEGSTLIDGTATGGGDGGSYHPQLIGGGELYIVQPWNGDITFGLGVFVPYGANVNYKSDWAGRFSVDRGAIESVNVNPSMAIRFDDKHSVGFGVSGQAMHLRLRSRADVRTAVAGVGRNTVNEFGGGLADGLCSLGSSVLGNLVDQVCNGAVGAIADVLTSTNPLLGTEAVEGEGVLNVEGYGFGLGWNAGYLYSFNDDRSRISLAYRSKIRQTIKGDFDWDFSRVTGRIPNPDDPLSVLTTGAIDVRQYTQDYVRPDTQARIELTTPESVIGGVFHQLTPRLALMSSINWTRTSRINELRIEADSTTNPEGGQVRQGDVVVKTAFKDVIKAAVGANYQLNDKLMLRTGIGFEQSPIPDAQARHASLPDADRHVYSLGLNYRHSRHSSVDLAYSYITLDDARADYKDDCHPTGYEIDDAAPTGIQVTDQCTGNGDRFKGVFKDTYVHSVGFQLNQRF